MKGVRVTIRIEDADREKIEAFIKKEYPKFRTQSQVIRAAIREFLKQNEALA